MFFSSYREKAKKDAAAVGNHVAKLLQSIGQVSFWAERIVPLWTVQLHLAWLRNSGSQKGLDIEGVALVLGLFRGITLLPA